MYNICPAQNMTMSLFLGNFAVGLDAAALTSGAVEKQSSDLQLAATSAAAWALGRHYRWQCERQPQSRRVNNRTQILGVKGFHILGKVTMILGRYIPHVGVLGPFGNGLKLVQGGRKRTEEDTVSMLHRLLSMPRLAKCDGSAVQDRILGHSRMPAPEVKFSEGLVGSR